MRILFITASSGNGHNSTVQKIKNKILSKHKEAETKVVDMYKDCGSKLKAWIMDEGYALACNHMVRVYNHFFKKSEKSTYSTRDKSKVHKETFPMLYGLLREIYTFKPDIIVCTYIFAAVAVCNLRRCYEIPAKVVCMTLDYGISPYWECATSIDEMFITDKYMVEPFIERGWAKQQLVVSGIPVGDEFLIKIDKKEARKQSGLDTDMWTLLVTRSSFFPIKNRKLIKEFKKIKLPIQIIICNGADKKGQDNLDKLIKKAKLPHKIHNHGYVSLEQLGLFFSSADVMLCKGGGLTLTEAITKGVPTVIVDKLPQQEVYNSKYLVEKGCALSINKKNSISQRINTIIENPKIYKNLVKNIQKIQKLNVLDTFLSHFEKYPKADYSNIPPFTESKSDLIRKTKKARKESIQKQERNADKKTTS